MTADRTTLLIYLNIQLDIMMKEVCVTVLDSMYKLVNLIIYSTLC